MTILNEDFLDQVLHILNRRKIIVLVENSEDPTDLTGNFRRLFKITPAYRLNGIADCIADLAFIVRNQTPVAFANICQHTLSQQP